MPSQEAVDSCAQFFELAGQYTHLAQLDRDTLLTVAERIETGPKIYENGGHKVPARANQPYRQSVRIFYKFIGELTENSEKCSEEKPAQDGGGTPREVGVNLKEGYNGDLSSREAGFVGGQMVKKMMPIRTASFTRADRTAVGHQVMVTYLYQLRM